VSKLEGMLIPYPMPLSQQATPFDDPDWIYQIKYDGFRALAVIKQGQGHCHFLSRKKHKLYGHRDLGEALLREVQAESAVLDGELVVTDHPGRTCLPI
jgi:bifunctional non-homologous end joining protein LigD